MTPEQLQKYWDANPEALQAAVKDNPLAFLSGGLQNNYQGYQQKASDVANQNTLQGRLAGEDFAYVPGGRREGVLTGGAYLPEKYGLATDQAASLIERSGLPKFQDIDGQRVYLNTGFEYTDGNYIIKPDPNAPVGSYSVVGQRRDGVGAAGLLPIIASAIAGPLAGAAVGALGGGGGGSLGEGPGLFDSVSGMLNLAGQIGDLRNPNRGTGDTYDPSVEARPNEGPLVTGLPGDLRGPGGLFDIIQGGHAQVTNPLPQEGEAAGGGGSGGGGAPSDPVSGGGGGTGGTTGKVDIPEGMEEGALDRPGEPEEEVVDIVGDLSSIFDDLFGEDEDFDPSTEPSTSTGGDGTTGEGAGTGGSSGAGGGDGMDFGPFPPGEGPGEGGTGSGSGDGGDGEGDGEGEGVQGAARNVGMGRADFEKFMAGIDYHAPMIQQLQIPLVDYMAMWMRNK